MPLAGSKTAAAGSGSKRAAAVPAAAQSTTAATVAANFRFILFPPFRFLFILAPPLLFYANLSQKPNGQKFFTHTGYNMV
jgi:hypothetical protein